MNIKEMLGRMDKAIDDLTAIRAKEELTEQEEEQVRQLVAEVNDLGPKIKEWRATDANISEYQDGKRSNGAAGMLVAKGDAATVQQREVRKSLGERFVASDEFKTLQNLNGQGAARMGLESFHMEQRALVSTGTLPDDYLEPMRVPGIQRPSDPFGSLRDVLTVGQTDSDALIFFKETAFTNNAGVVGEATATGGETGLKSESALTFDQETSTVVTIAHWIPITKQTLWNAAEIRTYIEGRLIDGLKLAEDDQLLNGDGTSGNMTGLLETSGVQALDATYFTANPVADSGTVNELFNRILRARTLVATVGRAQANFVVLNPADHEVLQATTDAQRQYFGAGPFAAGNVPSLWGMRTVINERIAEGTALVGDGRQATIWDRMQAQVSAGLVGDQFIRNMLTLLAEERVGLTVFRPQAFAAVELAVTEAAG